MAEPKKPISISSVISSIGEKAVLIGKNREVFSSGGTDEEGSKVFFSGNPEKRLRRKAVFLRASEQSFFLNFVRKAVKGVLGAKMRSVGIVFFIFGFINALSYFSGRYLSFLSGNYENLFFGLVTVFVSIFVSLGRSGVGEAIKKSFLFNRIISPVFGFSDWEIATLPAEEKNAAAIIVGVAVGLAGVLFSPTSVIKFLLVAVASLMTAYKPEAGLSFICAGVLVMDIGTFVFASVVTVVSFFFKVLIGKRSIEITLSDILILAAVAAVIIAGLAAKGEGSLTNALITASMVMVLFVSSNLIRRVETFNSVLRALALALFLGSVIILADKGASLLLANTGIRLRADFAPAFSGARDSGVICAMLFPVVISMISSGEKTERKVFHSAVLAAATAAVASLSSGEVWIVLAVGVTVFLVLSFAKSLIWIISVLLAGFAAFIVLPEKMLGDISEFFGFDGISFGEISASLKSSAAAFSERFPWGGGFSDESLLSAESSGNMYFEVGILLGVFGLAVFYVMIVTYFWKSTSFVRNTSRYDVAFPVVGAMCGTISLLFAGLTGGMGDFRILALMLIYVSLPAVAEKSCRREESRRLY